MKTFLLLTIIISSISFSQNFSRFVVIQKDGTRIEGHSGKLTDSLFIGIDKVGNSFSSSINDINRLYYAESNKTLTMGALGFLAGLALGLSIDYNYTTSSFRGNPVVLGSCSVLGLLTGGLVGSNSYNWKNADLNSLKSKISQNQISSFNISFKIYF